MPLITDSEMDDFDAAILQAGFHVDDFRVVDLKDEPTAKEQYRITGTVTVHRISTGHAITYRAGHGSTWVVDFLADFYAGEYGRP
jgi:hypothetical protein